MDWDGIERRNYDSLQNDIRDIKKMVESLDKSIRGNGKPGLEVRVNNLETYSKLAGKLFWLLMTISLTPLIAVIISKIKF